MLSFIHLQVTKNNFQMGSQKNTAELSVSCGARETCPTMGTGPSVLVSSPGRQDLDSECKRQAWCWPGVNTEGPT